MTKVRLLFLLLRSYSYVSILSLIWFWQPIHIWWIWLIAVCCMIWGSLDQWKRPDEVDAVMRRGVWIESLVIFALILLFQDSLPLYLCISPLARSSIHLGWAERAYIGILTLLALVGIHFWLDPAIWSEIIQFIVIFGTLVYAGVLGELLRERDRLRKLVALDAAERERRIKDEERLRMATYLHDTQGQSWTAVLRSIDVAMHVTGEQQQLFLQRARDAAQTELQQMRTATHDWYKGQLSPDGYIADAWKALRRMEMLTDVKMHISMEDIEWNQMDHAIQAAELVARTMVEASTNSIRHGNSKDVWLQLQTESQRLNLIIRDNGDGVLSDSMKSTGIGLASLTSSAQNYGGSLQIEGVPGVGTHVILQIPYLTIAHPVTGSDFQ